MWFADVQPGVQRARFRVRRQQSPGLPDLQPRVLNILELFSKRILID